jgi:hypothetical protein
MKGNGIKNNLVLTLLLLVLFCIVAVGTRAIGVPDMPASFLGAALGAVITAVVTQLLLKGQAKAAEETERNVKIFELKKDVFTKYINKVWEIWSDQQINDNEFEELCSLYYKDIVMYLKKPEKSDEPDKREKFINCLIGIGECLDKETDDNFDKIKENVFEIINILVKDLGLGGTIDKEQHTNLAKALFPGFFRKTIEKEIFNVLQTRSSHFLGGQYEPVYYEDNEYLCFYFNTQKTAGSNFAKIIIGPFKTGSNDAGKIRIDFYTEMYMDSWCPKENLPTLYNYKLKETGWWRRIIQTKEDISHDIYLPMEGEKKGEEYLLNFGNIKELEKYLRKYPTIAKVLAERVGKFIDQKIIWVKDKKGNDTKEDLTIIEFMKLYKLIE